MPRYIDADALIDNIPQADLSNDKKISKCGAIADMVLLVCDAPTIDVAPVVHGEWKYYHKQNKAVCTNCSFERDLDADFGAAIDCPNCGAKMDGGEKHE